MRRIGILLLSIVSLTACDYRQGGTITAPEPVNGGSGGAFRPLSLVIGRTWYGPAPASTGDSATLTINFTSPPNETFIAANIVLITNRRPDLVYTGTLTGTLENMVIVGSADNPVGGTRCGYSAQASINAAGDTITGVYQGNGPEPCPGKAGSFVLHNNDPKPPTCVGSGQINFPLDAYVAMFPVGWPNPFLPSSVGPFPFVIPAGTWHLVAVTGDTHSTKNDGEQKHEQGHFVFDNGVTTIDTTDIADNQDLQGTDLGVLTFGAATSAVSFVHYVETVTEPTDSLRPISIAYSCPAQ